MFRKILLVLALSLLVFAVGCAEEDKPETTKTPIVAFTPKPTEEVKQTDTPAPTEVPVYTTVEPGTGKYHGGIKSENPYIYEAFDIITQDSGAIQLMSSDSAAIQFFATTTFDMVGFICPSMGDNIGNLTLKIYSWQGTYELTVKKEPLHTKEFVDYADNQWLDMEFEALPDGEYVLVAEDSVQNVGVWKTNEDWEGVRTYVNGEVILGAIKNHIRYTNTPTNLTYKLSD